MKLLVRASFLACLALAACGVEGSTTISAAPPAAPAAAAPAPAPAAEPAPAAQAPSAQAPSAAKSDAPKPAADVDLKSKMDQLVRKLRETQDLSNGSYGGGVEGTAWVLAALADCPRKYRRTDGPFVQKALEYLAQRQGPDGAIHDPGAKDQALAEQHAAAVTALNRHADAESKALLAKALAYAGASSIQPAATGIAIPAEKDAMKALARELCAKQGADGLWDGPKGKVIESARVALALSEIAAKTASAPKAAELKPLPKLSEVDQAGALAALHKGAEYLVSKTKNGLIEARPGEPHAGLTAMAAAALACVPEPRPAPVEKVLGVQLAWLVSLQKPDGSIHDGEMANYTTSAAICALARAGKPEHKPVIQKARDWLIGLQADEAEGYSPDHPFYGGNSYGDDQRPDLSNVQFALEALAASGLEQGNPAYARALTFLQRCQNRSESNTISVPDIDGTTIVAGNDGGASYAPGVSKAGFIQLPDGKKVARSYGSMSYALLKSYILCGLPKDDPRMQACWEWLRKNWTLDVNPGLEHASEPNAAYQGLYYYLHTMAKTLALYGAEEIVDGEGQAHPWRKQLAGRLVSMQSKLDGSWTNENSSRWYEGNPVMSTTYALLSLDAAMPK